MSHEPQTNDWSPWPGRMALLLVCATFPLIWVGGLVTTYEAGMAVPDWPGTFGYNLFLYPWQTWFFGPWDVFIEHGHRLLGAAVGFIAIGFVVVTWLCDSRVWMKWLAVAALLLVILQGVLGGVRVLQSDKLLAQIHGVVGPAFLALASGIVVMTSRWWYEERPEQRGRVRRFGWIAWTAMGLALTQLLFGSHLRHAGAFTTAFAFGAALWMHVVTAIVFILFASGMTWYVLRHRVELAHVRHPISILTGCVLCQIILGVVTWVSKYGWPVILAPLLPYSGITVQADSMWQSTIVTAHQAMGSLILACSAFVATRASRREYSLPEIALEGARAAA